MHKSFLTAIAILLSAGPAIAKDRVTRNPNATNEDIILHAWSWNFPTIARNMKTIHDAGYTIVQTSPAQACLTPPEGNTKLFSAPGEKGGNWYHYYQPTDWTIGNDIVGTRDQLKEMLDSAAKYNIRVIVDVLPNHTAFDVDLVSDNMIKAVGGRDKLYHSEGLKGVQDYNDRYQCTLWGSGNLPDVNTENPDFQKYYMQYVNELLNLGVRGFRYDTAKHIGVHSDPVDKAAGVKENDFWDVATGRKTVKGVSLAVPYEDLFVYGEVLQDKNVPETEYADYFGQTASGYGHWLRQALEHKSARNIDLTDWRHRAAPEYLTTWVESHDTYCNAHESAGLSDDQIRMGWVFLTARQNGVPLFFSRPMNSAPGNVWGDNIAGARGNDEFFHPEVIAVNQFRKAMKGQKEDIRISDDGTILIVNRGKKGAAIVNINDFSGKVDLPTNLPSGTYKDKVYGKEFKVKNGRLTGFAAPLRSYIIQH